MPSVKIFDMAGKDVGSMELSEAVFGITPNEAVLHSAVRAYLLNQRQGTQSTLTRAEVRGGGRKPWKQKGTGRARQGSTRSPQWTHGGIALGPKPRVWHVSLNKKVKQLAIKSALSSKALSENVVVVDKFDIPEFKTKTVLEMLKALGASDKKVLIVNDLHDIKFIKSAGNIEKVRTTMASTLNVFDLLHCDKLILAKGAVESIEGVYNK